MRLASSTHPAPIRRSLVVSAGPWLPTSGGVLPLLDLKQVHPQWWPFVDFILFFALFAGIVHATAGRRFEGRGGAARDRWHSARPWRSGLWASSGPMASTSPPWAPAAAGVFRILLGVALFWLFRTLGMKAMTSLVSTVVALALVVSAISPQFSGALSWVAHSSKWVPWSGQTGARRPWDGQPATVGRQETETDAQQIRSDA